MAPKQLRRNTDVPDYSISSHTGVKFELKDIFTIIVVVFGLASVWYGLNSRVEKIEYYISQAQMSDGKFQEIPPRVIRLEENDKRQDDQIAKINGKLDDLRNDMNTQFKAMDVHFRDIEVIMSNNIKSSGRQK